MIKLSSEELRRINSGLNNNSSYIQVLNQRMNSLELDVQSQRSTIDFLTNRIGELENRLRENNLL
jgi:hypothetical protein